MRFLLHRSLSVDEFLEQVARRGSWVGGGSVAALSAALSAALLEKLVTRPRARRTLQQIRSVCVTLIDRDAETFSGVIQAMRRKNQAGFRQALRRATDVPQQVVVSAATVQAACRVARRTINPRFQSDLRCAEALAKASGVAARALIRTNLVWLKDPAYTRATRRRLAAAMRRAAR